MIIDLLLQFELQLWYPTLTNSGVHSDPLEPLL